MSSSIKCISIGQSVNLASAVHRIAFDVSSFISKRGIRNMNQVVVIIGFPDTMPTCILKPVASLAYSNRLK